jgi:hypothetical protein
MPNNFDFSESGYTPSYDFNFGLGNSFYILAGTSDNFIAIWADPTTSLTSGRFYVSSSDAFSVVESSDRSLYDFYTSSHAGRGGEALLSSDIVDINC